MNRKGFTLIELLATLVILGIIMGVTLILTNGGFKNAKDKTEDIFVKTITDAIEVYISSDAKNLSFDSVPICSLNKTHKKGVNIYKSRDIVLFNDVINSSYSPITLDDMHNPANKDTDKYECDTLGILNIYRDDDYIYYYKIDKSSFNCLNGVGVITNLPDECNE